MPRNAVVIAAQSGFTCLALLTISQVSFYSFYFGQVPIVDDAKARHHNLTIYCPLDIFTFLPLSARLRAIVFRSNCRTSPPFLH